jgi:uncharacterized peroxidase-related enzyme
MSRIKVIGYEESGGKLRVIYDQLIQQRKQLAAVHQIQSLRPESILKHMDLYMEIMFSKSELSRAEREMMAVLVSVSNGCLYCQTHHGEALNQYWKDSNRLKKFISDYKKVDLSDKELALCTFAEHLTKHPDQHEEVGFTQTLKEKGLCDSAVLDAVLVISYFNFVNRIVLSLGVSLEKEGGKGYEY